MSELRVCIVGCTHAGTIAAITIREANPKAKITIIERNDNISYLSCGIALGVQGVATSMEGMFYNSVDNMKKLGFDIHSSSNVTDIDFTGKTVNFEHLQTKQKHTVTYDKIVISCGSWPIIPPFARNFFEEGNDQKKVFLCKNYDHAKKLVELVKSNDKGDKSISIIGGGYIGIELVEAFAEKKFKVHLVEGGNRIMQRYFCADYTSQAEDNLKKNGVELHLEKLVKSIDDSGDKVTIDLGTEKLTTDYVVLCIGFMPNTKMVIDSSKKSGKELSTLPNGAIIVNEHCETSITDVYAVGDAATHFNNVTQQPSYIPLATTAIRLAVVAALNICGTPIKFPGTQGTSAIKIFGKTMVSTGVNQEAAEVLLKGTSVKEISINDKWRPEFMPDSSTEIHMRLTYIESSGVVIGAQIVSDIVEVAQMINTVSLAIANKMTVSDLMLCDFFFNPWFGKPVHIINLAAIATTFTPPYEEYKEQK
ncbi:NADH oxidase [Spironucleus salmonicida]|uniref:NADH oxidase n=1 Tax=Spironucleus salmonicida TaxID=348837 RepID=V6LMU9_9EUKA|nr:NADH oxidase [Spironucleus salmonicida]|eukprot:EST45955.1 NADH oxidase [Spironucleus salmonicida]